MPRPKHISVYLISNGDYWKAKWRTGSESLGPKANVSERSARLACKRLEQDLNAGRRPSGSLTDQRVPRLGEWFDTLAKQRQDWKPATRAIYEYAKKYLLAYFDNDPVLTAITPARPGARQSQGDRPRVLA